jgi:hypothetical protein
VDFSVTPTFTNYDKTYGTNGKLTLTNVSPGASYSVGGTVTVVNDINSVTVCSTSAQQNTFPEAPASPIDLSALSTYLKSGMNFPAGSIQANVYLSGISTASTGSMTLTPQYTGYSGTGETEAFSFVSSLASPLGTDGVVSSTLPPPSASFDLSSIINARPSDLRLNYSLTIPEITLTGAQLTNNSVLKAELVLVMPFKLDVASGGSSFTISGVLDGTQSDDLFGRSSASSDGTINQLLANVNSMTLLATVENGTGLNVAANLTCGTFSKTIDVSPGTKEITLTSDDVRYIMNTYPFSPKLELVVPEGSYTIIRDSSFKVSLGVKVVTDIDQTIDVGSN